MNRAVVVTYALKPEAMDEHVRLIEAVLDELRSQQRDDVDYRVLRLDDGVSFVHVATYDAALETSPLSSLASFRAFSAGIADRVATPPAPRGADVIGEHRVP